MPSYQFQWKTKWLMADGDVIMISKMDDNHLVNTMNMLHQWSARSLTQAIKAGWRFSATLRGEMAQDLMDSELEILEDMDYVDYAYETYKPYPCMLREVIKRGLQHRVS